jgi:hypothetical protein
MEAGDVEKTTAMAWRSGKLKLAWAPFLYILHGSDVVRFGD